jgi:formylglycine-generating enzyme required for sulfatase activity
MADRLMPREVGKIFEIEPSDYPVGGISLEDARAYCEWRTAQHHLARGKGIFRLPTSDEWEKAARGVDGRIWPFGNSIDSSLAHLNGSRPEIRRKGPIGVFPQDESPYGVRDVTGSVREWVDEQEGILGLIRGASYAVTVVSQTRAAAVSTYRADQTSSSVGFRLVWVPDDSN